MADEMLKSARGSPGEGLTPANARRRVEDDYRSSAPVLLAFLKSRVKDSALAEDIVHDVFIAYYRQLTITKIDSARAYLFQAAHRLSLNALRQRSVAFRNQAQLQQAALRLSPAPQADQARAGEAFAALAALDDQQREVLSMRVYGGLTFREVAESLDLPLATVFKRYEEATAAVRQRLDGSLLKDGN